VQVLLIDKNTTITFTFYFLSVSTGGLDNQIRICLSHPKKILKEYPNFLFSFGKCRRILPETNTLMSSIGTIDYDYLVFGNGAKLNFFGNSELKKYGNGHESYSRIF